MGLIQAWPDFLPGRPVGTILKEVREAAVEIVLQAALNGNEILFDVF